jgi:hypothetical protein
MRSYSSEKLLLASSCPSVSQSVRMAAVGSHGFLWNLVLRTFIKICREIPNSFKIGQNFGVGGLYGDISPPQNHFCATCNIFILLTVTCSSARHTRYCCVYIATMFTRTTHIVTLYVHCLPCFAMMVRYKHWVANWTLKKCPHVNFTIQSVGTT